MTGPRNGPPPIPDKRKKEWTEEEFHQITRHNRLRWLCIGLTTPLILVVSYVAIFPLTCFGAFAVFLASCAGVHQFWTNIFSGSKLYGSVKYQKFKRELMMRKFREEKGTRNGGEKSS